MRLGPVARRHPREMHRVLLVEPGAWGIERQLVRCLCHGHDVSFSTGDADYPAVTVEKKPPERVPRPTRACPGPGRPGSPNGAATNGATVLPESLSFASLHAVAEKGRATLIESTAHLMARRAVVVRQAERRPAQACPEAAPGLRQHSLLGGSAIVSPSARDHKPGDAVLTI